MKLLTVSAYFESHRGGIEIVAGRLARELAVQGAHVRWLAGDASPGAAAPPSTALRAWNFAERRLGIPYPLPRPGAIASLIREVRDCDVVLAHDALYATSVIAILAAKWFRRPTLLVQHIGQIPYRNWFARSVMALANAVVARFVLSAADQVVFISDTPARFFAGLRLRRPPLMIFNGVDTKAFRPPAAGERQSLRRKLGLSADRPQALFVGRFVEKKGLAYLRDLAAARPDIDWVFAGWGQIDPQAWASPNVRVFRDLSGLGLGELYRACDVFVLPSVGEGFPLVVQEALASGLEVVCGAEVALADPAATSLLRGVDLTNDTAKTVAALSLAVSEALRQASGPQQRSGELADFAAARYAWSGVATRYMAALNGLIPVRPDRTATQHRTSDASRVVAP